MLLVILGVLLLAGKLAEVGPTAQWPWWGVLLPFVGAAVWWAIADKTGLTRKRAMDKMETKKHERRKKNLASLGITSDPKADAERRARAILAARVEGKRKEKREANEEVIRNSVLDSSLSSRIDSQHHEPKA